MPPAVFSVAMATGITATGLQLAGWHRLGAAFTLIAAACFLVLAAALAVRAVRHRAQLAADLLNPAASFGFFTTVAAANVLGLALGTLGLERLSLAASAAGLLLWLVLTYAVPGAVVLHERKTPALASANGSWFLWAVATQSVAGALAHHAGLAPWLGTAALCLWLLGCLLYLLLATLVTLRMIRYPNKAETLSPTYWIFMGATAISVLTGSTLLGLPQALPPDSRPVISLITLALLSVGLWFIPLLVVFGIWRHGVHRHPLRYETGLWAIVFPTGMLATACLSLGALPGFGALHPAGMVLIWCAVAGWLGTTVLFLRALARRA